MPLALHDADANGIIWPKYEAASSFDHIDITNGRVPLVTLLASCDTYTSINNITWPTSIQLSWLNKCSGAIDDFIGIICCWCQWHFIMETLCCIPSWLSWCNKWNGAIDNTDDIMWHWHKHQWNLWPKNFIVLCFNHIDLMNTLVLLTMPLASHGVDAGAKCQMTEKVMLHLILIILNLQMQWYYWWCHMTKMFCNTLLQSSWSNKWYHWQYHQSTGASSITCAKESCDTLFKLALPNEENSAIDDVVSITW